MTWVKIRNNLHPIWGSFLCFCSRFHDVWRNKSWLKNVTHLQLRTWKKGFCNSLLVDFPGLFGGHHRLGVHHSVEGNMGERAVRVRKLQVPCSWKRGSHRSACIKILLSVKTGYYDHEWFIQMWIWDWFVGEIYGGNCLLQVSVVLNTLPQAHISTVATWWSHQDHKDIMDRRHCAKALHFPRAICGLLHCNWWKIYDHFVGSSFSACFGFTGWNSTNPWSQLLLKHKFPKLQHTCCMLLSCLQKVLWVFCVRETWALRRWKGICAT